MVVHVNDYYQGKCDETNPFIDIEYNKRKYSYGELLHDSVNKNVVDVSSRPIGVPSGKTLGWVWVML